MPTEIVRGVHQLNMFHAAFCKYQRTLHPGGSGTDNKNVPVRIGNRGKSLRVPTTAILLAGRGVLRAGDVVKRGYARDANIAANTLADLVQTPLLDLLRKEWIGDRRTRRANQVPCARLKDRNHLIRVRKPTDANDGFGSRFADAACPFELVPRLRESGRPHVKPRRRYRARIDVPKVDEIVSEPHECECLFHAHACHRSRIEPKSHSDCATARGSTAYGIDGFEPKASPVLKCAAICIGALVVERREELHRQISVAAVDVHDVDARCLSPCGGL